MRPLICANAWAGDATATSSTLGKLTCNTFGGMIGSVPNIPSIASPSMTSSATAPIASISSRSVTLENAAQNWPNKSTSVKVGKNTSSANVISSSCPLRVGGGARLQRIDLIKYLAHVAQ